MYSQRIKNISERKRVIETTVKVHQNGFIFFPMHKSLAEDYFDVFKHENYMIEKKHLAGNNFVLINILISC